MSTFSADDLRVVEGWRDVYDFLYEDGWADVIGEDFTGWDSVYDGTPIPVAEMREWRMATVDRVLALRPRRVLEIGVGDGHILAKVAPLVDRYVGTDLSSVAIDTFRAKLTHHPRLAANVELHPYAAHETGRLTETFDTVILNSVVQYFPGLDYLRAVIDAASARLTPGGRIYLGDVRNARSARVLASAVQLRRMPAGTSPERLRREVAAHLGQDRELLVDPAWFAAPGPADIQLRRGYAHNELTRHRYDVVLHPDRFSLAEAPVLPWGGDLGALGRHLRAERPGRLRVVDVPDDRLAAEVAADRALHDPGAAVHASGAAVHEPGAPLNETGAASPGPAAGRDGSGSAVDPESFHEMAAELGYRVAVTFAPGDPGAVDVLFVAGDSAPAVWTDVLRPGDPGAGTSDRLRSDR
ncbi:class I SAM-dependent methyltransferase [Actinoplanes sp. NPDC051494]|uniref:class I SAM-dependent methyltransferase n=1 Tax=Actinoplanes sp. NPDC051494 TaxID=3363907 RepID=UPI0037898DCA